MRASQEAAFEEFAAAVMPRLRRVALGATGEPHAADDLVQATMVKVYLAWPRVSTVEHPFAYARQVLVRALVDERRRPWWQRELSTDDMSRHDRPVAADAVEARLDMTSALRRLAPRQRMCVVLRHLEGLSVKETAALMRCSEGTVKSTTSDALRLLRGWLDEVEAPAAAPSERGL